MRDNYCNIGDFRTKNEIIEGDSDVFKKYETTARECSYTDFIKDLDKTFFTPVFSQIQKYLEIESNMIQIKPDELFLNRLIYYRDHSFLRQLMYFSQDHFNMGAYFNMGGFGKFLSKAIGCFITKSEGHQYTVDIQSVENDAFKIDLQYFAEKSDKPTNAKGSDQDSDLARLKEFLKDENKEYQLEKSLPMSVLGKGANHVLQMILKIASIIFEVEAAGENNKIKKFILIEEPETFLHPEWQSRLADLFTFCTKNYNVQFFIETHSEYLVRKLQYLTAKKEIEPDQSVIYYFNHPDAVSQGKKHVNELRINEDGSLTDDFGPGFFDEADNIAIDLYRMQRNYQKN